MEKLLYPTSDELRSHLFVTNFFRLKNGADFRVHLLTLTTPVSGEANKKNNNKNAGPIYKMWKERLHAK